MIPYELPESTLAPSHAARVLWRVLETLDLSEFERSVKGVEGATNAQTKGRLGLGQLLLRGVGKVTCVVLLTALTANLHQQGAQLLA